MSKSLILPTELVLTGSIFSEFLRNILKFIFHLHWSQIFEPAPAKNYQLQLCNTAQKKFNNSMFSGGGPLQSVSRFVSSRAPPPPTPANKIRYSLVVGQLVNKTPAGPGSIPGGGGIL